MTFALHLGVVVHSLRRIYRMYLAILGVEYQSTENRVKYVNIQLTQPEFIYADETAVIPNSPKLIYQLLVAV